MSKPQHVPVLLDEVLQYLNVRPGGVIADATVGLGGHSAAIAKRLGAKGRLICFDRDPEAMELAKARLDEVRAEVEQQASSGRAAFTPYVEARRLPEAVEVRLVGDHPA